MLKAIGKTITTTGIAFALAWLIPKVIEKGKEIVTNVMQEWNEFQEFKATKIQKLELTNR